jgi:hypothetical protein
VVTNEATDELVELMVADKANYTNEANIANEADEAEADLTNENATD